MAPLEGWYDAEEFASSWKTNGPFRGGDWASDPVESMDTRHGQSSWIPTSDGRKRFHRDLPIRTSSATVPSEQISNMTGETPLHDLIPPVEGGWNEQMLGGVPHVSISQPEVKCHRETKLSHRVTMSQDVDTDIVDRPSMYTENYVSKFATLLLPTDEINNEGNMVRKKGTGKVANGFAQINGWDSRRRIADCSREKDLRNQETLFAAETSNAIGQNLWPTPFCTVARDTGGSFPSARSVSSEGRQSEVELKMEQSCLGEVPNLIPDRNGHMQGIREAVPLLGGLGVQIEEFNQRKALLELSQLSELNTARGLLGTKITLSPNINFTEHGTRQLSRFLPQTGMLTNATQECQIPCHDGDGQNNFTGRSVETLSLPLTPAVPGIQHEHLSLQLQETLVSLLPPSNKFDFLGGSNQSSDVRRHLLHLTPALEHPPHPKEHMVGVQQSYRNSRNGLSTANPAFQQNLQNNLVNGTGQGGVQQAHNTSWQQVMNGMEHDAVYKQPQLNLPQGLSLDTDMHSVGSDGSDCPADWTSNEGQVIQKLQTTMLQLDVGTRLCIRDALYRLAKSAKERRSCRVHNINQGLTGPDSGTVNSCITGEVPCDGSRCDSEKQTNHLDRSIASLLFNTGPFWKYSNTPAYKFRSVSQPLTGLQNGPWQWSSAGMMGNDWSSSSRNHAEALGAAPRILAGNPLNSAWAASPLVNGFGASNPTAVESRMDHDNFLRTHKTVSPDNYHPLDTQADGLNMTLPSRMRSCALLSPLNFDISALPSDSTMISECTRPNGSTRGQEMREIDLDVEQAIGSGSSLVNINYQSPLIPYTEDVGIDVAANAPSLQGIFRLANRLYDGAGNCVSKLPLETGSSQFTYPDGYGCSTAKNRSNVWR